MQVAKNTSFSKESVGKFSKPPKSLRTDELRRLNLSSPDRREIRNRQVPELLKEKTPQKIEFKAKISRKKYFESLNDVYSKEELPKRFIRNQIDNTDIPGAKSQRLFKGKPRAIMFKYTNIKGNQPSGIKPRKRIKDYNYLDYSDVHRKKDLTRSVEYEGTLSHKQSCYIPVIGDNHALKSLNYDNSSPQKIFQTANSLVQDHSEDLKKINNSFKVKSKVEDKISNKVQRNIQQYLTRKRNKESRRYPKPQNYIKISCQDTSPDRSLSNYRSEVSPVRHSLEDQLDKEIKIRHLEPTIDLGYRNITRRHERSRMNNIAVMNEVRTEESLPKILSKKNKDSVRAILTRMKNSERLRSKLGRNNSNVSNLLEKKLLDRNKSLEDRKQLHTIRNDSRERNINVPAGPIPKVDFTASTKGGIQSPGLLYGTKS
ncbi:unnamed protein product [Moneuplotes crassus]|uniref:Uncharacterized protein n=1 Tax=Euplotes crassus TaxID=5936 RepID=A0AAD1UR37_EUPCR|nr:unnamed protein product [Moneuplotes crassus]